MLAAEEGGGDDGVGDGATSGAFAQQSVDGVPQQSTKFPMLPQEEDTETDTDVTLKMTRMSNINLCPLTGRIFN